MGRWAAEVQVDTMNSSHLAIGNSQDANNIWAHTKPSGKDVHVRMHARMQVTMYACIGCEEIGSQVNTYMGIQPQVYTTTSAPLKHQGWMAGWLAGWDG